MQAGLELVIHLPQPPRVQALHVSVTTPPENTFCKPKNRLGSKSDLSAFYLWCLELVLGAAQRFGSEKCARLGGS